MVYKDEYQEYLPIQFPTPVKSAEAWDIQFAIPIFFSLVLSIISALNIESNT